MQLLNDVFPYTVPEQRSQLSLLRAFCTWKTASYFVRHSDDSFCLICIPAIWRLTKYRTWQFSPTSRMALNMISWRSAEVLKIKYIEHIQRLQNGLLGLFCERFEKEFTLVNVAAFLNKWFAMVIVDSHFHWPEVYFTTSFDAEFVIIALQKAFNH